MNEDYIQILNDILAGYQTNATPQTISSQDFERAVYGQSFRSPEELLYTGVERINSDRTGRFEELAAPYYHVGNTETGLTFYAGNQPVYSINDEQVIQNNTYIGGTTEEARNRWWSQYPDVSEYVGQLNEQYGLPSNYLQSLLSTEGSFVDSGINLINSRRGSLTYGQSVIDQFNPSLDDYIDLTDVGYDIANEEGEWNRIQPYLQRQIPQPELRRFTNEKNETRQSGSYSGEGAFNNALELVAAKNKQLLDKVESDAQKQGLTLSEEQKAYWVNVYWNSGETAGPQLLNQSRGQFISPTYNGRVTAGTNGQKFLRQYRTMSQGGSVTESTSPLGSGKLVIKDGVNYEGTDPALRNVLSKFNQRGVSLRITSAKSNSGHSDNSYHYRGEAIDITPVEGDTYEGLLYSLRQHPDLIQELQSLGYGLHDETKGGGKGWTGAHLHIGKDKRIDKNNWNTLTVKDFNNQKQNTSNNAQKAFQYFVDKGLSPEASAGIVGNLIQESSEKVSPSAYNKQEGAYGIAQWRGDRYKNLESYATTNNRAIDGFDTQLDFLFSELQTTHKSAYDRLVKAQSPEEAADIFNKYYERSADKKGTPGYNRRINSSNLVYDTYRMRDPDSPSDVTLPLSADQFATTADNSPIIATGMPTIDLRGGDDRILGEIESLLAQQATSFNSSLERLENLLGDVASSLEDKQDARDRALLQAQQADRDRLNELIANSGINIIESEKI